MKSIVGVLAVALAVSGCASTAHHDVSAQSGVFDIAIINGRVIDPETGLDAVRNVGVRGDRIAVVTTRDISGVRTIDAAGKVVAPGFIDLHAHGQSLLANRMQALDGVTTALELEAGVLPISEFYDRAAAEGRALNYGASSGWAHARISELIDVEPSSDDEWFFSHLDNLTWQTEIADDAEIAAILARVQHGLDDGGLGIGVLLGYAPGSGRKEYYALNALAAENGVPTFTHARFLSAVEPNSSFEGFQEMVGVATSTGVQMHICHLNSIAMRDIGDIAPMIAGAQAHGAWITVEAYPYGAGSTGIGAAMFRGANWQERFGDIKKSDFTVNGEALTDVEFDRLQAEEPGTEVVVHFLRPDDRPSDQVTLDRSVLYPGGAIASDGGPWSDADGLIPPDVWPLPEGAQSHPRSAGTFARFLRIYVREREAISLTDAIAKVSLIPAQILEGAVPQMRTKGRLQVGADADIVVFDLATVSDQATYEDPAHGSVGFEYVIVGGTPLVVNGVIDTAALPGRAIRRDIVPRSP